MKAKLKSIPMAALCAVGLAAFAETSGTGVKDGPWPVGKKADGTVAAYVENGKLVVEGAGAMKDFDPAARVPREGSVY